MLWVYSHYFYSYSAGTFLKRQIIDLQNNVDLRCGNIDLQVTIINKKIIKWLMFKKYHTMQFIMGRRCWRVNSKYVLCEEHPANTIPWSTSVVILAKYFGQIANKGYMTYYSRVQNHDSVTNLLQVKFYGCFE